MLSLIFWDKRESVTLDIWFREAWRLVSNDRSLIFQWTISFNALWIFWCVSVCLFERERQMERQTEHTNTYWSHQRGCWENQCVQVSSIMWLFSLSLSHSLDGRFVIFRAAEVLDRWQKDKIRKQRHLSCQTKHVILPQDEAGAGI